MSPRIWQERVQDLLDTIAEIDTFVTGLTREQFLADAKTLKAVTANLSIIGEAARHVPDDIAQAHPEIPWPLMRGMRNRIIHEYYRIDPIIVWDTCRNDLPPLVEPLKRMLEVKPS